MESMLSTKGLSFAVDKKELIHNITLDIPEGSFVGLVGPNGCGKSTLLKTIYRANKASEGTVYINGERMDKMSNREMAKKMAVVTQENEISFDFSVMEIMMIGRFAYRKTFARHEMNEEQICRQALEKVGMQEFADRSFLSLSGGEKQRVLIAGAFAREAKLIVLDEPTNHLDVGYQFLIMDIMKQQKGITVFTSVHDMNMALRYCDYLIALKKGEIEAVGTPEEVLTKERMRKLFRVDTEILTDRRGNKYIHYLGADHEHVHRHQEMGLHEYSPAEEHVHTHDQSDTGHPEHDHLHIHTHTHEHNHDGMIHTHEHDHEHSHNHSHG